MIIESHQIMHETDAHTRTNTHTCCPSASSVIFSVSSRIPSRSDINFRDCSLLVSVAAVTCDNSNLSWTYSPSEADDVAAASDDVGGMIRFDRSQDQD